MNKVDLLFDDYTTLVWPEGEIHSRRFPYLVIRAGFGVYSPITITEDLAILGEGKLIEKYKNFPNLYGYQACLAINDHKCFYFKPDGVVIKHDKPPSGGSIINWLKFQKGLIKMIGGVDDKRIFYSPGDDGQSHVFIAPNPQANEK